MKIFPRILLLLTLFIVLAVLNGCAEIKAQFEQMASLSKCNFRLASVDNTTLSGIRIQGISRLSDIPFMDMIKLQGVFTNGTLPLSLTLNLEAQNPNSSTAGMNRFAWILLMDGNELTEGMMEKRLEIAPNGGVGIIPLEVSVDLMKVLTDKTLNSMTNLALNIAGEGTQPTRLTIKMKPSISVAGRDLDYPNYVTVTHEFSSGNNR